jgi:hypothetical protein
MKESTEDEPIKIIFLILSFAFFVMWLLTEITSNGLDRLFSILFIISILILITFKLLVSKQEDIETKTDDFKNWGRIKTVISWIYAILFGFPFGLYYLWNLTPTYPESTGPYIFTNYLISSICKWQIIIFLLVAIWRAAGWPFINNTINFLWISMLNGISLLIVLMLGFYVGIPAVFFVFGMLAYGLVAILELLWDLLQNM